MGSIITIVVAALSTTAINALVIGTELMFGLLMILVFSIDSKENKDDKK